MGINVLFIYPNTFGMNMLPPAIAMFTSILKKEGHYIDIFDTTYYSVDHGIDSDGSKMEKLNVAPYSMESKGIRLKNTDWKQDIKDKTYNFKPDLILLGHVDRIDYENFISIKEKYNSIKFAQWFLDPLNINGPDFEKNKNRFFLNSLLSSS